MAFTLAVIANLIVVAQGKYVAWVGLLALVPLMLLMLTGLYLFVLPYASKWRANERGTRQRVGGVPPSTCPLVSSSQFWSERNDR